MSDFTLTKAAIEATATAAQDAAGGYVVFEGRVRNRNDGRDVRSLEYEAFDEMAVRTGNEVLSEARKEFPILDARCVHRTGHLQIGDIAIRVEVASAHRKAAFEACDWIVDEVKTRVPIWKKEHYVDGDSGWINCEQVKTDAPSNPGNYYSRQTILKEVGEEGQRKLGEAQVLVVGAGGLGSSALLYLAAAGVGTIGIAEFDSLDESNLHRQVLYSSSDVGSAKAELAAERLRALNPHIQIVPHKERIGTSRVDELLSTYDLVLDCTDNFHTKFLLNDASVRAGKTLIQASIYRYEGQILVVNPGSPCLRCLWPVVPEQGCVGSCAEVGVLGVVPGVFGSLQAAEAIKAILDLPSPLRSGHLLLLDLLDYRQQLVRLARNPHCPACGDGEPEDAGYNVAPDALDLTAFVVIDVREPEEVAEDPIKDSVNIPSTTFDVAGLPPGSAFLLVCASGARSESLARRLWSSGDRRFFSLVGGVASLRDELI